MRFIHNDQVWAVKQEKVLVAITLQEINASDLHRIVLVDTLSPGLAALKLIDGAGADNHRFDIELFREFLLPLLAQVWRA